MAAHHGLPVVLAVDLGRVDLAADRGRVEEQLGALEHHRARGLGEPLVPADADADARVARVERLEPRVARAEVELLFVGGKIGDVALAVVADDAAVGVDDRDRVVVRVTRALEERHGQHELALPGDLLHALDGRLLVDRMREVEVLVLLVDAEVGRFEELLQQDDLRARVRGLVDERFGARDVGIDVPAARHLGAGDRDFHGDLRWRVEWKLKLTRLY